jgi:hypothetical protein
VHLLSAVVVVVLVVHIYHSISIWFIFDWDIGLLRLHYLDPPFLITSRYHSHW